jgi:hypothetical protein
MPSLSANTKSGQTPLIYHYYNELGDALKSARAADRLELPFVLYKNEDLIAGDDDEGEYAITYVVAIYAPGASPEIAFGDDDPADDTDD